MITQLKEKTTELMNGEITLTALDFCLIGAIMLLAGVCIGLLTAPFTHGISLCSNNGNNNGNNSGNSNSTCSQDNDDCCCTES